MVRLARFVPGFLGFFWRSWSSDPSRQLYCLVLSHIRRKATMVSPEVVSDVVSEMKAS